MHVDILCLFLNDFFIWLWFYALWRHACLTAFKSAADFCLFGLRMTQPEFCLELHLLPCKFVIYRYLETSFPSWENVQQTFYIAYRLRLQHIVKDVLYYLLFPKKSLAVLLWDGPFQLAPLARFLKISHMSVTSMK